MRRDMQGYGELVVISGDFVSVGCSCLVESGCRLWCGALKLEDTGYLYLSSLLLFVRSESLSERESYKWVSCNMFHCLYPPERKIVAVALKGQISLLLLCYERKVLQMGISNTKNAM